MSLKLKKKLVLAVIVQKMVVWKNIANVMLKEINADHNANVLNAEIMKQYIKMIFEMIFYFLLKQYLNFFHIIILLFYL